MFLDPSQSLPPHAPYLATVSRTHEHGGFGSTGYRAPWSDAETRKLLLRTHTTASSTNMLYRLSAKCRGEKMDEEIDAMLGASAKTKAAGEGKTANDDDGFRPAKLFSIDRVFR